MRKFLRIFALLALFLPLFALETNAESAANPTPQTANLAQSKLVYIKSEIIEPRELSYIGEIIALNYSVLVLENAQVRSLGFLETNGINILNAHSSWIKSDEGAFENTIYFKITAKNFAFPTLEVIVENAESSDIAVSESAQIAAIDLRPNHPNFAGVVAKKFEIKNYSVREYDKNNNIVLLDLSAEWANLEDLKLPNIKKQGFESLIKGENLARSGIFYAIVPIEIPLINLEYFDLNTQTYKQESLKNIVNKAQISINQEIAPINKALIFKNIVLLALGFALFVAFFVRKIPFKVRVVLLLGAIICVLFVIISANGKEYARIRADSYIRILPTTNSTIIAKIPEASEIQVISTHNNYVKILTKDGKTGWSEKENIE